MKNVLIPIMVFCFYLAGAQTPMNIERDIKFAREAAKGGLLEVKLGGLAQTNASIPEVKMSGQHMIDDHSKANQELKSIANKKNISLPSTFDDKMQKNYDQLAKLNGKRFDRKYAGCMVHDHKKDICLFKKEARKGNDPELKVWANGKIPTLKTHLKMWKEASKAARK